MCRSLHLLHRVRALEEPTERLDAFDPDLYGRVYLNTHLDAGVLDRGRSTRSVCTCIIRRPGRLIHA